MGIWSSCQSLGNIMGAFMVNSFLGYGFEYSFFFISYCLAFISIMIFFSVVNHPKDVGLVDEDLAVNDGKLRILIRSLENLTLDNLKLNGRLNEVSTQFLHL